MLTIENSRSSDAMVSALAAANYGRDLGPGVYDVHSPQVSSGATVCSGCHDACAVSSSVCNVLNTEQPSWHPVHGPCQAMGHCPAGSGHQLVSWTTLPAHRAAGQNFCPALNTPAAGHCDSATATVPHGMQSLSQRTFVTSQCMMSNPSHGLHDAGHSPPCRQLGDHLQWLATVASFCVPCSETNLVCCSATQWD